MRIRELTISHQQQNYIVQNVEPCENNKRVNNGVVDVYSSDSFELSAMMHTR